MPVRDVFSERVEILEGSLASIDTTSDVKARLVGMKQLNVPEVVSGIEVKTASPFTWTKWTCQRHLY